MSALKARLYEPKPTPRSMLDLIRRLDRRETPWPEMSSGERGIDIGRVCFRDLNTISDTAGGYLADSKQPKTAIEYLGSVLAAAKAGAVSVAAKAADFSPTPKEVTPPTMYWVTEGTPPPAASDGVWGAVAPSLKTGVVWSDLTRDLTKITGRAADRIVTRAFFRAVSRGVDHVVFHGGGGTEPIGITSVPNIGTVDGAAFSLATACSMLQAVEDANASAITWIMSPDVAELLRQRPKAASGERMLFEDGKILDFPAIVSNSIDPGFLFVGNFSSMTILNRSLELLVDQSSGSTTGRTRLLTFWHGDVIITTPQSFCVATAVS